MIPVSDVGPLLITVPDLGTVSDADEAQLACALASGLVLDYIGRPILSDTYTHTVAVSADIVTRDPDPSGTVGVVHLPATPVDTVTTVVVDGETLTADRWAWDASRGRLLTDTPDGYAATVTYTAGYTEVPAGLRAVARRVALDQLANPGGVQSERLADYNVSYAEGDFTTLECRILDRYRPQVGTIRAT